MPLDALHEAGPLMLSRAPITAPEPKAGPDWQPIYTHLEARLSALRTWRWSWWVHWARLAEMILPYRYKWLVTANTMNRGSPLNQHIVNETATLAMQICAHGLLSGLMSGQWFQLEPALPWIEPDAQAREWLEDTEERLYTILARSNFYTAMAQAFRDVSTFGTAPLIINEDAEDIIRCYLPCCGEYYLAAGGRLSVDTLYREFTYTVNQLVDWFGLENCPHEVQAFWRLGGGGLEREFVVAHAIEPNFALASPKRDGKINVVPGSFPWREVYWLRGRGTDRELSRRGFNEKPFMVARWSTTSNDPYGRSPGMDAYGGTAQLQHEERRKGEYIDKGVRPPMGADPELEQKPSSILSGEITYVNTANGHKGFWPLYEPQPNWLPALTQDIKEVEQRINRCFFVDVFMAISQMEGVQPRNELEILERKGERVQQLGPVVQLFETEFVPHALKRVAAIAHRRGAINPPPDSLRGVPVKFGYHSTLKLLLQAAETAAMERGWQTGARLDEAALATGQAPPSRIINKEKSYRLYLRRIAYPMKGIYSEEEVQAIDTQAARAKQMAAAGQVGMAAVQAAEGLSKVDVGGGVNAVQALLGNAPQQGAA